jgi:hypothetical protein
MATVTKLRDFPLTMTEDPKRPYRLWNANQKKTLRWRYYASPKRAHLGALIEARWAEVGTVIEVFDARNAALLGQYRRTPTSVAFFDIHKLTQEKL